MWCDGADLSNDMQVVKSEASRIRDVSELSRPTNAPPVLSMALPWWQVVSALLGSAARQRCGRQRPGDERQPQYFALQLFAEAATKKQCRHASDAARQSSPLGGTSDPTSMPPPACSVGTTHPGCGSASGTRMGGPLSFPADGLGTANYFWRKSRHRCEVHVLLCVPHHRLVGLPPPSPLYLLPGAIT